MEEQIFFLNMFPDYEPPEELYAALSQAAIAAADIDPETRSVHVALHSERYIPQRLLEQVRKDICGLYGLQKLELTATHPESELQKIEPEELMCCLSAATPWRGVPSPGQSGNGTNRISR